MKMKHYNRSLRKIKINFVKFGCGANFIVFTLFLGVFHIYGGKKIMTNHKYQQVAICVKNIGLDENFGLVDYSEKCKYTEKEKR